MFDTADDAQTVVDTKDAAESAGLRYVSDSRPGLTRRKSGGGFSYLKPDGTVVAEPDALRRIRSLAIPPAWTDVWISSTANGHIQATGRDAKGRKQYLYHPRFREIRESTKYEHVVAFADSLSDIIVERRMVATIRLLDRTCTAWRPAGPVAVQGKA